MPKVKKISLFFFIPIITIIFVLGTVSLSIGQNTNWTGAVSDEWENAGNWSNGVPNNTNTAVINWFNANNPDPVIRSNTTINALNINNFGRPITVTVDDDVEFILNNLSVAATGTPGQIALNVANGHVTVNNAMTLQGAIFVENGSITFLENFTMASSSLFEVQTGTVNIGDSGPPVISANFTQTGGSIFNLNQGTLNIFGSSEFTGGGVFNAGTGNINLNGDIQFNGGSDFNADESTVNMSGDVVISSNSNQDATFHNLNVAEGANVSSTVDVTVTNDMIVTGGSDYNQEENTNLNVIGNVTGDPQVESPRPFLVSITILNQNSIRANFNQEITLATAENASNYLVREGMGSGSTIIDNISTAPSLGGANNNQVTIVFDNLEIQQGIKYFLHVQNIQNLDGQPVNNPHVKRFEEKLPPIFFSITNGNWNDASSWSIESHTGNPANRSPGADGDQVIIGNGNQITINSLVDLTPIASASVENGSRLEVAGLGELIMSKKIINGDGAFELLPGGTIQIGSADGIETASMSGNIQTGTRSFSTEGSYIYNGDVAQNTGSGLPQNVDNLRIENSNGVSLANSVRANGTLFLTDGILTVGDGLSLIADNKDISNGELRYQLEIGGQAGYRLLSSPINTDLDNFLSEILTQGFNGASLSGDLQPNVLWYDESVPGTDNQRWRAPTNSSNSAVPGRGYHVYMFDDVAGDSRYNEPLPYTLDVVGQENEGAGGTVDLQVTYTAEADTGWNLVGNPFGAAIDWNNNAGWNKENIDETIYIWDPNTNQYKTWNGFTGDIADGIIAPFQGFWVKANSENPELQVNQNAKTVGGEFVGKLNHTLPMFSINAEYSENLTSTVHFLFSERSSYGLDIYDAYKLMPPPGISSYLEIYSVSNNGDRLAINSLPRKFGKPIEIPIELNGYINGEIITKEIEISVNNFQNIPEGWSIEIVDKSTGQSQKLDHTSNYIFSSFTSAKAKSNTNHSSGYSIVAKSDGGHSSFVVRITPGFDSSDIPSKFDLKNNFPNPFNPSTTFQFELPLQSAVRLEIYDMLGRRVAVLADEKLSAGTHERRWNASGFSSGVYIARLITIEGVFTQKTTLVK